MGWVDPWVGLGWVGLGWVGNGSRIFVFSGLGWVMGLKWQICEKQMSCTYVTLYCRWGLRAGLIWWLCCCYLHWYKCILMMIMVMTCTSVSSYARPFVVRCMGVGPSWVRFGMGWVGSVIWWVGLGLGRWNGPMDNTEGDERSDHPILPGKSWEQTWTTQIATTSCSSNILIVFACNLSHSRQAALWHQHFHR